jgi:DNA polymerase-2
MGIVPKTLRLILRKRADYKQLRNEAADPRLKEVYDRRQNALKWILVTCFGYLGYKNARLGKVDAHIAVCAFARDALLKTAHLAEGRGFQVVHGIVDSLWVEKEGARHRSSLSCVKTLRGRLVCPSVLRGDIAGSFSYLHECVRVCRCSIGIMGCLRMVGLR